MSLFPKDYTAGIFRGFSQGGLEFHADIILPYQNRFQTMPMHGMFVLVQLESEEEAVLGRITSISSRGRLASGAGEDFGIRAIAEGRDVPEDLREQYLKYEVDIRVLGLLRQTGREVVFAASHRRLPHVGSKVAFLAPEILRDVVGHNDEGVEIGHLAFGEFIHAHGDRRLANEPWMRVIEPLVVPRFDARELVAKRTLVFARAGFGKSNLVKLLFSNLYSGDPSVTKRGGRQVPVGTVVFDPDGEYFWPDDKGRPGFCDVPALRNKIVVFTPRRGPSPFYDSFVAGNIRLDIRRLRPGDVVSIALSPERQSQQNVRKIVGLNDASWRELVDLIHRDGNAADEDTIKRILALREGQEAELYAARANMTHIVRMLHDPSSQMLDMLRAALQDGKLCVVDISQMRGSAGLTLSGIILRRIFENNQAQFTEAQPRTIPTIAVIEEAQSVLNASGETSEGPYIEWVKEGRKYDLGAVLITQQPGSIPNEILSQGDNWFIFHLLSAGDLAAAKRANAHFSEDLLSSLLNEPIEGQGVYWSSAKKKPIPVPIRVISFEGQYQPLDKRYDQPAIATYASQLRARFAAAIQAARPVVQAPPVELEAVVSAEVQNDPGGAAEGTIDVLETYSRHAVDAFRADAEFIGQIRERGMPWRGVQEKLKESLPEDLDDRDQFAYNLVKRALNEAFGNVWKTERRERRSGPGYTTWVVVGKSQ